MDADDRDNALAAWWLGLAPSRQEELLSAAPPPMPWLDESLADAGLDRDDLQRFLRAKRDAPDAEPDTTRDAGLNPRPG